MQLSLHIHSRTYQVTLPAIDIAIPLHFNGVQPNTYGVPHAKSHAFEGGGFVGDTRRGGSCNFEQYTFVPHCNGTHTECIGHITKERIAIHQRLQASFMLAALISITPVNAASTSDSYNPAFASTDWIISRSILEEAWAQVESKEVDALIIRTLPNDVEKQGRDYMQMPPPFFSLEAMQYIVERGIKHLLIDMPSVDRLFDEGKLSTHRIFWGVSAGGQEPPNDLSLEKTITEMIYVPNEIQDGLYLLELQIAAFMSDASPSRPRLFALTEVL